MMLCKADFEDLFPDLFRPGKPDKAIQSAGGRGRPGARRFPENEEAFVDLGQPCPPSGNPGPVHPDR